MLPRQALRWFKGEVSRHELYPNRFPIPSVAEVDEEAVKSLEKVLDKYEEERPTSPYLRRVRRHTLPHITVPRRKLVIDDKTLENETMLREGKKKT